MARATVTFDFSEFDQAARDITRYITSDLAEAAHREFVKQTPKQSGNARRKTQLVRGRTRWDIVANYDYAQVLDQGLYPKFPKSGTGKTSGGYSTQAPQGMSKPTSEYLETELQRRFRRYQ
jgi:hypothetical protein